MDFIPVTGKVELIIRRPGVAIERISGTNLVVTAGKNLIVSRLGTSTKAPIGYLAMGTSDAPATIADVALIGTELERVPAAIDSSGNLFALSGTFGASIIFDTTFAEFGLFNDASAGDMLARFVITSRSFTVGDEIDIAWQLQFGA